MGEQVSYRETFALRVVNTQVTAVSRSDHRGEFRIGGRGQVKLQYTMGEVDMSASLQVSLHQLKESTQQRGQSIGLSIILRGYSGNANANYLNNFQLERGCISRSMECIAIPFQFTSNYTNKIYLICI